ncbi:MAG: monovalent cation/H(+) antiporter subunit G [Rhodocyclaceae bacterium]|nr:monovalent cation/H(+) antiporter subunit G [Rhodocyclaceae bacterium]
MIVVDVLTWVLVSAGGVFCVIGALGMLRMPDFFTRMHAASVIDTLGAGLIIVGLILQSGFTLASLKLVILGLLIFFTSPTASHALANAALERGAKPVLADQEGESPSSPP